MAAKLLNIAPSKTVSQTPYEIWHGKPASYKYLRVWGSPAYVMRLVGGKLDSRSSLCRFIGYLKETVGYYFYNPSEQKIYVPRSAVFLKKVPTDGVPVLRRSIRESRPPERVLGDIKAWLSMQFSMKDMGEASYILGIKIYRDRSRRMLGLTQSSYIEKVLKRFKMENSKRGFLPMRHGIKLCKKQTPKTDEELKRMSDMKGLQADHPGK
ncbi:UNVERIFIED_CONTAM: hypothetical protein Slati_4408800 [Sesamum latifolium]|uniref:Retroviral polymerase SH3-like domain-containing protein n=1 Tax=Sesamum latifolium TaxID=2727402 RepID=A0AAW2SRZ2_9LAMI